ncbi:uncharacterized protein Z520_05709 [Fonsecaea multimorphosa CBS 102226]|uniref:Uncharacterized protein n=1 Tax=Fonsecaea multimorphosa CBS 102226 TaxID=1442371 RepID=A0A0D2KP28_9EURO|nr:uncharacterized protein Z520_05709 [Fonsecaea multimorphosa CBS 102226]KIX98408.1 hypothetical protein Z520_05709 [Fonsecaea multimorphosa CBS 102226]OAL24602.1 hypothetical protein AYO22_05391 [Fonsecaea multimorphosa]
MDHRNEQEAGRQRMRDLFQQREMERGSLRHKRIFKTPEEEAKQAVRITPNWQARNMRQLTATRGPPPVFDENIWDAERQRSALGEIRSVSPRTRIGKDDDGRATGGANGDGKKSSVGDDTKSKASHNDNKKSHSSASADKKKSS